MKLHSHVRFTRQPYCPFFAWSILILITPLVTPLATCAITSTATAAPAPVAVAAADAATPDTEMPDEPAPVWQPNDNEIPQAPVTNRPLWESARRDSQTWTTHAAQVIQTSADYLLRGTDDVVRFCPRYHWLPASSRVQFWIFLTSAITKYESGFSPTARYLESTMGTDPVTGRPVYSEGLLQLSYQDKLAYPFCNDFDWRSDKKLSAQDPRKTIFDPFKNLACGIRILDYQARRYHLIAFDRSQYWAVLRPKSKASRVSQIQAMTRAMPLCRDHN